MHLTKVVADFNATTGPNVSKLNDGAQFSKSTSRSGVLPRFFHNLSSSQGTVTEEDCSETMTKAYYNIANDHLLEEISAKESEESSKEEDLQ